MSRMQIDLPSPPPLRPVGHKRPRSSSSPPLDRPAKRVSLSPASVGSTPSPLAGHGVQQEQPCLNTTLQLPPPLFHEQRSSDDWVAKTDGLRLDGPLFSLDPMRTSPLPESGKRGGMDAVDLNTMDGANEPMNTNIHDASRDAIVPWPFPNAPEHVATQSPFDLSNTNSAPFPSLQNPTKHPPTPTHAFTQHSNVHIHIQPSTPSHRVPLHSSMSESSPISVSPSNSRVCSPSTPSSRKPRVTMGPRPDCEKCRMGVKGHWMHIE